MGLYIRLNTFPLASHFSSTMTKCTPEKKRAFSIVARALPQWQSHFVEGPRPASLCTGALSFSDLPFQLPPHTHWTWNKSSGETKLAFNQNTEICLQKMNAKKRKSCSTATPSYKLWLYSLGEVNQPPHLFGVWCERGVSSSSQSPEEGQSVILETEPDVVSSICSSQESISSSFQRQDLVDTSSSAASPPEVKLSDFSFLTPYIAPELAREFGWSGSCI